MPCFKPLTAWLPLDGGQLVFKETANTRELEIPCGQCIGCRINRQQMWAFRCLAEASLHEHNWFVTLTYAPDKIPPLGALQHRDWQLFAKRARRRLGPFRYLMCGEYGEKTNRPHYHALLFGLDLPDAAQFSVRRDNPVYRSPTLEKLWGLGLTELGTVTAQSARYCAGYVLKRSQAPQLLDESTGELMPLPKPYGRMSLKPALGDTWVRKYHPELFAHGCAYSNETPFRIPDRFKHILDEIDADSFMELQQRAIAKARTNLHNTRGRLAVREEIQHRRLQRLREIRSDAI